jgi:hypothetical protein
MRSNHPVFTQDESPESISGVAFQSMRPHAILSSGSFNTELMAEKAVEFIRDNYNFESLNNSIRFSETVRETQSRFKELNDQADSSELTPLDLSYLTRGDMNVLIENELLTDKDCVEIRSTVSDYMNGFAEDFYTPQSLNFSHHSNRKEEEGGRYMWRERG